MSATRRIDWVSRHELQPYESALLGPNAHLVEDAALHQVAQKQRKRHEQAAEEAVSQSLWKRGWGAPKLTEQELWELKREEAHRFEETEARQMEQLQKAIEWAMAALIKAHYKLRQWPQLSSNNHMKPFEGTLEPGVGLKSILSAWQDWTRCLHSAIRVGSVAHETIEAARWDGIKNLVICDVVVEHLVKDYDALQLIEEYAHDTHDAVCQLLRYHAARHQLLNANSQPHLVECCRVGLETVNRFYQQLYETLDLEDRFKLDAVVIREHAEAADLIRTGGLEQGHSIPTHLAAQA